MAHYKSLSVGIIVSQQHHCTEGLLLDVDNRVDSLLSKLCVKCNSELCLKNLNELASIGLVEMDEDCFLLKPAGFHHTLSLYAMIVDRVVKAKIHYPISNYQVCNKLVTYL